jgi:hypothetical protein
MIIVPHGTGTCNNEYANGLNKRVDPKSCEDKIVEHSKMIISPTGNRCEYIISTYNEARSTYQSDHYNYASNPIAKKNGSHEYWNQYDLTNLRNELSSNAAYGNCQSDSAAAA